MFIQLFDVIFLTSCSQFDSDAQDIVYEQNHRLQIPLCCDGNNQVNSLF